MLRQNIKFNSISILLGAVCAFGFSLADAQVPQSDPWNNPDFIDRFIGTYAPRITVEPRVSPTDKTYIEEELLPVIQSDRAAAKTMLIEKAKTPDSNASFDMILANMYYQDGQLQQAVQSYENAIKKHKDFLRAHENIGFLYFQLGNLGKDARTFYPSSEAGCGGQEHLRDSSLSVLRKRTVYRSGNLLPFRPDL